MRYILLLLITLASSSALHAQGTWEHITTANGQELGHVSKIMHDGSGAMWVDTWSGTFCYKDGLWTTFTDSIGSVQDFTVSSNGDVWFSVYSSVVKYDGTTFQRFAPEPTITSPIALRCIAAQSDGVVWVANGDTGVLKFDGEEWQLLTTEDGLVSNDIDNITVSPNDELWISYGSPIVGEVGGLCYGVSVFNGETWRTYDTSTEGINGNSVMGIAFDAEGNVFISYVYGYFGLAGGISKFNGSSWEWLTDDYWGYGLNIDSSGNLWFYHDTDTLDKTVYGFYDGSEWTSFVESPRFWGQSFDVDNNAWFGTSDGVLILTPDATSVEETAARPQAIELYPNYPNPFNPETTISFSLPESSYTTLSVYSMTGQKVATLADGMMSAGVHSVVFDGATFPSGTYIAKLCVSGTERSTKITLIK